MMEVELNSYSLRALMELTNLLSTESDSVEKKEELIESILKDF